MNKNKKLIIFFTILALCSTSVFAGTNGLLSTLASANFKAMDIPLLDGMGYFIQTTAKFADIASILAICLFLVCILWNVFRLWIGTQQVRKAAIDIISKYLLYVFLFFAYGSIRFGVIDLSMQIGAKAGGGAATVGAEFEKLQTSITEKINFSKEYAYKIMQNGAENGGALTEKDVEKWAKGTSLSEAEVKELADKTGIKVNENAKWYWVFLPHETRSATVTAIRNTIAYNNLYKGMEEGEVAKFKEMIKSGEGDKCKRLLAALNDVLVENPNYTALIAAGVGASTIKDSVSQYIYNPFITASGQELNYKQKDFGTDKDTTYSTLLSPATMIKTGVLIANVLQTMESLEVTTENGNPVMRVLKNTCNDIMHFILCFIMTLGIMFSCVFCAIQYIMCIFEYFITTSIGIIFIPCVLWDGTKSFAAKLVTLFTSYFIKIMVMVMCMFWVYAMYIKTGMIILNSSSPCSFLNFSYLVFTLILGFVLTQNAPQVALTVLNGSPQLSMGEFLHAAGTAVAGAVMAKKAANSAPVQQAKKTAQGFVSGGIEGVAAGFGAASAASGAGNKMKAFLGASAKQAGNAWGSGIVNSASKLLTGKELVHNKADTVGVGKGNKTDNNGVHGEMTLGDVARHYRDQKTGADKGNNDSNNTSNNTASPTPETPKKASEDMNQRRS